jgi:hypothetical protein
LVTAIRILAMLIGKRKNAEDQVGGGLCGIEGRLVEKREEVRYIGKEQSASPTYL